MNGDRYAYFGLNTRTRKYEDIACTLWEYTHTCIDFLKMLMEQKESYQQCIVYNDSHIDECFESEKGEINMEIKRNLRHFVFCFQLFFVFAGLNVCGVEIRKVAIFEGEI